MFIRVSEFATIQRTKTLVIPKGDRGRGWDLLRKALCSVLETSFKEPLTRGTKRRKVDKEILDVSGR